MCGCEWNFVCTRCEETPDDWRTWIDSPKSPAEIEDERRNQTHDQIVGITERVR